MKVAILLILVALAGCDQMRAEKSSPAGRYQLVADPKQGVWRIDTATGKVSFCESPGSSRFALTCFGTTEGP